MLGIIHVTKMTCASSSVRVQSLLAMYMLLETEEKPPIKRRWWFRDWIRRRHVQGAYANLLREMQIADEASYCNYLRVDHITFKKLLEKVRPRIVRHDTNLRLAISAGERLAITLRFLATGESYRSLQYQFRVGKRTIAEIVPDTCKALYDVLHAEYLMVPTSEEAWRAIAEGFETRWNLPHCVGTLDGKHIVVRCPSNSGSTYYNYKNCHSIVLLALVDHDYKFTFIDVGTNGRVADGGVFAHSLLHGRIENNSIKFPQPDNIHDTATEMLYFIVADEAFPLKSYLLKPYPQRNLSHEQRIYNYRISRGRRIVENAFGIMASRFRVFLTTILLEPEVVELITIAACALHNFLRTTTTTYITSSTIDREQGGVQVHGGEWRAMATPMLPLDIANRGRRPTDNAKAARETMREYFSSDVSALPWQDAMV